MRNFDLVPSFIFRTPLLSWNLMHQFVQIGDKEERVAFLKKIFSDDLIREAIYIASPSLFASADAWIRGEVKEADKQEKLISSLTKYLLRMGTRCTPFGLFAGVSHGKWGNESRILTNTKEHNLRFTGLDMEYIFNVKETLLRRNKDLIPYLLLFPNTALHQLIDKYKFIDYQYNGDRRKFSVSVVSHTDYLGKVLEKAASGVRLADLLALLSEFEVSEEEATQYVQSLIEKQILVTELEPVLTEGYYFDVILTKLEDIQRRHSLSDDLQKAIEEFRTVDRNLKSLQTKGPVDFEALYDAIRFKNLQPQFNSFKLFQTDMIKPTLEASLSYKIASAIRKGAEVLNRLSTVEADGNLNVFKDSFRAKYDTQAVPILELMDAETGLSYPGANAIRDLNPLVDDITVPPPPNVRKISTLEWSRKDSILLAKLLEARKKGDYNVHIADQDIADLPANWDNLPDALNFVTSIVHSDEAESGIGIVMIGAGLSSAVNIFSRFSHLDKDLHDLGDSILQREREVNPDVILAELVHLPDYSRIGNILQRSFSHAYQLLFMAGTTKDRNQVIELNDLYVSLQQNRFVLFSKKHGKEVRVKLNNAHNYTADTHPIYCFLGDLQFQGLHWPLQFHWGPVERVYRFLPRVNYKADSIDLIISPATWLFDKKDYQFLLDAKGENKTSSLLQFRGKWSIPDLITLSEHDHDILIDFKNELCTDIFFQLLGQRDNVKLKEFIGPAKTCAVQDTEGQLYTNELVALFTRKEPRSVVPAAFPGLNEEIQRNFPIGSEWLFFKFYVGTKGADDLLTGPLKAITDDLLQRGMIDKWFFIRYVDPGYHLRVRFHLTSNADFNTIIQAVYQGLQKYIDNNTIAKIQVDTYQREIERYGERSMELSETLFFYDSVFFVHFLNMLQKTGDMAQMRWKFILKSVDTLLDDYGLSLEGKVAFMKKIDVSERMGINKQAGTKYRRLEQEIDTVLSAHSENPAWQAIGQLLSQRSGAFRAVFQQIHALQQNSQFQVDADYYLASIIHMMINRICISKPNDHEYVVYDMLYRFYASRLARQKKDKPAVLENH